MTIYLGIDPGKTTGYAWVSYRDKQMILHDFGEIPYKQFMDWVRDWPELVKKYREDDEYVIVVCEDFIHRAPGPWTPSPVTKQIGRCYGKSYDEGWHFALSQPSNKTAGYKLAKYKGTPKHWSDAYVHCVFAIHQGLDKDQTIIW